MLSWLLAILLICGVIGGITSYLLEGDLKEPFHWPNFIKYLLLGLVASFTVPLFLNTISSTLVRDALASRHPDSIVKLLVISGFCLVAAVSSKKFITSLTDRLISEVESTRKIAQDAEDKVNLLVEPEQAAAASSQSSSSIASERSTDEIDQIELDDNDKRVLGAMINSTFATRAPSGIRNDTGIPDELLSGVLDKLKNIGYLEKKETPMGFERWTLTRSGKSRADRL
jgi:hypothetical protein